MERCFRKDEAVKRWVEPIVYDRSCIPPFLDEVIYIKRDHVSGEGGWFWILLADAVILPKRTRKIGLAVARSPWRVGLLGNMILKPLVARLGAQPCWTGQFPLPSPVRVFHSRPEHVVAL